MSAKEKLNHITVELKGHAPFTIMGALTGILIMIIFKDIVKPHAETLFTIFHPAHVLLSAMVTASLFALHRTKKNLLLILLIGYFGSIGIATLSDSVIPFFGESILGVNIPTHTDSHANEEPYEADYRDHDHEIHLGFIADWYIVTPAAILGVLIAYFIPRTKFPHASHVLISTLASSAHIMMNTAGKITLLTSIGIFIVLFLAVWLPCCISDIIFPLLFVKSDLSLTEECLTHAHHTHVHSYDGRDDTE